MVNRRFLIITLGIVLVVASFLYTPFAGADNSEQLTLEPGTGVRIGQNLAQFTLESLYDSQITVAPSGKIMVINFGATWCPPCREEMPELDSFAQANQEKVDFYAVNLQESKGKVSQFVNENGYTMPVLLDEDGVVAKTFKVTAIPTTIIVNKHGMIKYRKSGGMTRDELEGIINSL